MRERPPAAARTLCEKYFCRVTEVDGELMLTTPFTDPCIGRDFMDAYRELGLEDRIEILTGWEHN